MFIDPAEKSNFFSICLLWAWPEGKRIEAETIEILPEASLNDQERKFHAPYITWKEQGHLLTCPKPYKVVDTKWAARLLVDLVKEHDVKAVAFDSYRMRELQAAMVIIENDENPYVRSSDLADYNRGRKVLFLQCVMGMTRGGQLKDSKNPRENSDYMEKRRWLWANDAIKETESIVNMPDRVLHILDKPTFRHCTGFAEIKSNLLGNRMIVKSNDNNKNDSIETLVGAIGLRSVFLGPVSAPIKEKKRVDLTEIWDWQES